MNWHLGNVLTNDRARLGLEPRLADHRNQAARTVTLPTAPPRQAYCFDLKKKYILICGQLIITLIKVIIIYAFDFDNIVTLI